MNIYLAGKIRKNDWRHDIVKELSSALTDQFGNEAIGRISEQPGYRWPILSKAIFGSHSYTGPFFIGCDHGCAHGNNQHGVGALATSGVLAKQYVKGDDTIEWSREKLASIQQDENGLFIMSPVLAGCVLDNGIKPERLVQLCYEAITRSDLVFAWIESPDAYGTLVELGYAKGLGKKVWVAGPQMFTDLWFAYKNADKFLFTKPDAYTALQFMLGRTGEYLVPPKAGVNKCRDCGAPIVWTKTDNQKNIPLDLSTVEERDGQKFALVHFTLCKKLKN